MEFHLCQRFAEKTDFAEGVRCVLIDRGDKPKWIPDKIEKVDNSTIDWFFTPKPDDYKLTLSNNSKL